MTSRAGAIPREAFVSAVILAAGRSTRMGRPKLALEVGGAPMLRRVAQAALASRCGEVVVVLGADADAYRPLVADLSARVVLNPDYRHGLASSLRAGLTAVAPHAAGVVVLLADQPFVTAAVIDEVVARGLAAGVAATRSRGAVGPPAYFSRALFAELAALEGDRGARAVVAAHPEAVIVPVPDAVGADVDSPDDLRRDA